MIVYILVSISIAFDLALLYYDYFHADGMRASLLLANISWQAIFLLSWTYSRRYRRLYHAEYNSHNDTLARYRDDSLLWRVNPKT